jgi:hypothetical protein
MKPQNIRESEKDGLLELQAAFKVHEDYDTRTILAACAEDAQFWNDVRIEDKRFCEEKGMAA